MRFTLRSNEPPDYIILYLFRPIMPQLIDGPPKPGTHGNGPKVLGGVERLASLLVYHFDPRNTSITKESSDQLGGRDTIPWAKGCVQVGVDLSNRLVPHFVGRSEEW